MVRIGVNGASGRMGTRILALAEASKEFQIEGRFDIGGERLSAEALKKRGGGVLIDFSSPAGTLEAVSCAEAAGWGLVVGTTGLEEKAHEVLKKSAARIPVVVSSNMSVGVNVMLMLLETASKKLPKDFSVDMTEAHHIHKKDAPSGTASMLAIKVAESRGLDLQALLKSIKVIREGEIIGDHSVTFDGPQETIEIKHHAKSRDIFAQGALLAARFVASAKPGFYSMGDVLR